MPNQRGLRCKRWWFDLWEPTDQDIQDLLEVKCNYIAFSEYEVAKPGADIIDKSKLITGFIILDKYTRENTVRKLLLNRGILDPVSGTNGYAINRIKSMGKFYEHGHADAGRGLCIQEIRMRKASVDAKNAANMMLCCFPF